MRQDTPEDPERTRATEVDGPTVSMRSDVPTAGPPIATWSLDDLMREPLPAPPVRRAPAPPRGTAFVVSLTVAVMLVLGLVAGLVVLTLNRPVTRVAGDATGLVIPQLPAPTNSTPPQTATSSAAPDALAELAAHPLSASPATMPRTTCALPRFDPADAAQARFYQAAKVCADRGFGELLAAAGLPAVTVDVQTVQGGPVDTPCGPVAPTAPAAQCAGTVYMTPARLRDVERLDRYPGTYLGVFLREYAEAVQYGAGLAELAKQANETPGAPADLDDRLARQATCLAGAASGAMAGLGAVDANITAEIRRRLTSTDAPPDAETWLAKGFDTRRAASCNTWA